MTRPYLLFPLAALAAACTAHVGEDTLLRPLSGGAIPAEALARAAPAFTLTDDGDASTTRALLDTCFRQVEYAGVLAGAANPEGARAVIEWLLSPQVQAALPESMYVFPVRSGVGLPAEWARFAQRPDDPYTVDAEEITARREEWLTTWTDVTSR